MQPAVPIIAAIVCLLWAGVGAGASTKTPSRGVGVAGHGGHAVRPVTRPTLIGHWGDWRAATHRAAGSVVCYAYTRTASSSVRLPGRGDVVLTVTDRPGLPRDAVALSAGFIYPPGSQVDVTAGASRMAFYTAQRSAFARSGTQAVRAFRAVPSASAHSPAPRGRSVTDVFSMRGFGDAHAAIARACPLHA